MDPKNSNNIDNSGFVDYGYYNLQPPTAQINVNANPNYNNGSMIFSNTSSPQHANKNVLTNNTNSQFYPMSSYAPQNVGHVGQQISPHHLGNTSGNTFRNVSLPVLPVLPVVS